MKRYILIFFCVLSLGLNVYLCYDSQQNAMRKKMQNDFSKAMGGGINKTTWSAGVENFLTKLKLKDKGLAQKKYFYINTWANFCIPCINEMPLLDSLMATTNKKVAYVFVSDLSDTAASYCLHQHRLKLKNFIFINDANELISALCNELKLRSKVYPIQVIIDSAGKVYYHSVGAFENSADASKLISVLDTLK